MHGLGIFSRFKPKSTSQSMQSMKLNIKKIAATLFFIGSVDVANASVCNIIPGRVTCGQGTVDSLSGNGTVTVNGTLISGATRVNGLLRAENTKFFSLEVNGSAKLIQCTIDNRASVKGSLVASSTKFENDLEVFSSETRFIHSKLNNDLHLGHSDSKKQVVYLEKFSEVAGNIVFDDGQGEVIVSGQSKIGGKVIGGKVISQ